MMKKHSIMFLMVICCCTACTQCASKPNKEERALALINDYMFKNLYYYESYQPLDLKIDSAFHTPYNDTTILRYATIVNESMKQAQECQEQAEHLSEIYKNFGNKGTRNHPDPLHEFLVITDKAISLLTKSSAYNDSIRLKGRLITPDFIGWSATHNYSYKTKGGIIDTIDQKFIINKDFTMIINEFNINDKEYNDCLQTINKILEKSID